MNLFNLRRPARAVGIETLHEPARARPRPDTAAMGSPVFVRGQGAWLWDDQGRACLDFNQGDGVNTLGHSPEPVVKAVASQAQALINPGVGRSHEGVLALRDQLCQATGSDRALLFDSTAQAHEGAVRLARQWGERHRHVAGHIIVARQGGEAAYGAPVASRASHCTPEHAPLSHVPFNDLAALHAAVESRTVAVVLEPLQSQGAIVAATEEYLKGAEALCRELGILLILDEAHTGMGRCGALLAETLYGVHADMVVLGGGLGGGVPLAALLVRSSAGCTPMAGLPDAWYSNALTAAAGLAVLKTVLSAGFIEHVQDTGRHLREGLSRLAGRFGQGQVCGSGLLWTLQLNEPLARALERAALQECLLVGAPQADVLRLSPSLTVTRGNVDEMLLRLTRAFARLHAAQVSGRKMPA
ncbi:aminotransferase class III-fold pyridoxal phosphate-dependent enzyme [Pseudomonas fulva]|uniref:aminotransferase class III-fold pyridoxal phosphate-dependent enzyme n=1 Tax=Pseudomonas fulva TaxID=47880 RepID=UPI003D0481F0